MVVLEIGLVRLFRVILIFGVGVISFKFRDMGVYIVLYYIGLCYFILRYIIVYYILIYDEKRKCYVEDNIFVLVFFFFRRSVRR